MKANIILEVEVDIIEEVKINKTISLFNLNNILFNWNESLLFIIFKYI
jgi:hypothetical protein